ncbi:MAG: Holliday junction resolvase RuvX [Lachnospiraceae bacterium]|nr:Holliday junction resolvase RuvX [Lachnospiraceae bacterium]
MRIIGLDFGEKTVGVALSDELGFTAQPLTTVFRERPTKLRRTYAEIEGLMQQYNVELIVVGLPKGLDGIEGEMCARAREFGENLSRRTGVPVEYVDERLTTKAAGQILEEGNVKKTDRKKYIDKVAASIILQKYMDTKANS